MQKGNAAYIKTMNKRLILKCVMEENAITRAAISKKLSLSKPTVSTLVNDLIDEQWLIETGNGSASKEGGRKPVNLSFNATRSYIIGVDIGGTSVGLGLTDLKGKVCAFREFPTQQHLHHHLFEEMKRHVESMKDQLRISDEKILGLGAGIPGVTNSRDGIVIEAPALKWKKYPIKEKLEQTFRLPVHVDNDVNTTVLGEHWIGIGKHKKNLVYVAIGTGIGSGIMINGTLYRGSNYSAGEIGYLVTDRKYAKEYHPVHEGYGFLESVAGGASMSAQLSKRIGIEVTAKEAFELYDKGNKEAIAVIDTALENLAIGISNYVSLFDPELIILGGGVSNAFTLIHKKVMDSMKRYAPQTCEVVKTSFDKEAGVIGSVALFLNEFEGLFNI
ncbi:ROK family transcriptional regulator [Bacillaceae bacterium SIJ1]|uniref:ROK family transcriptional regulator n=1 Tax=Litoribacterium kuwaitense TaxID=1398745 RepID=UPI0013EDEF55|nr:ROK family transcriptional regulator [Litoribacterium kuwaitense]NGP45461.1 ROK family transcriptional regulator [Litoribacterium kuwaitense]